MNSRALGRDGEKIAAEFLVSKGYRILERNFKNKLGELDLVAKDGAVLVFVEVKSRKSLSSGQPQESVHGHKQRKLIRLALSYLNYKFGTPDILSRFDVVSIYREQTGRDQIEHIINAFDVPDR